MFLTDHSTKYLVAVKHISWIRPFSLSHKVFYHYGVLNHYHLFDQLKARFVKYDNGDSELNHHFYMTCKDVSRLDLMIIISVRATSK